MGRAKHTPGPWKVAPYQADLGASIAICVASSSMMIALIPPTNPEDDPNMETATREPEDEANANIIAEAPTLLETLMAAGDIKWVHNVANTDDIESLRAICLQYSDWWNHKALPLIEKLEGKS